MKNRHLNSFDRRRFLQLASSTVGFAALSTGSMAHGTYPVEVAGMTVQQVIDLILKEIPGAPFQQTVDTLKSGTGNEDVKGIVTTMFATIDVIRKTKDLGANFIIAHEPTFYSHADQKQWLETDDVFRYKMELLNTNKIVVWRFHDYWHTHRPDGVLMGVLTKLGWEKYYNPENPRLIEHPGISLGDLVSHAKKSLGIRQLRYVGKPEQHCRRIALLPGAAGGKTQIELLMKEKPDVLIVGEVNEWETAEYVRDAQSMGRKTSLIVLGHAESEEPGMEWLVGWLTPRVKGIKVTHLASGNPFREG